MPGKPFNPRSWSGGQRGAAQTHLSNRRSPLSRLGYLRIFWFGVVALFSVRLFVLQIVEGKFYRTLAQEQREFSRVIVPERGEILIHDYSTGELTPLATNKDVFLVYAVPRAITAPTETAQKLAPLLELSSEELKKLPERLAKSGDPYEPLKHGVDEQRVAALRALRLPGIEFKREPVRFYPLRENGAQVVGFVSGEEQERSGKYGLEYFFDQELRGVPGFLEGERDVAGRWIPVGTRKTALVVEGDTLVLTLDRNIQHRACTQLKAAVERHRAAGGSVVIAEARSGALLAMCAVPDFDPNAYSQAKDLAVYTNPIVSGQYEPGSVFKVLTLAAGLESGKLNPESTYQDTGEVRIGSTVIRNSDNKAHGVQTLTQVLEESLNTGAIYVARQVGLEKFRDVVQRFGFGRPTGLELPQEAAGDVRAFEQRGEIYLATASFGQGLAVTPLQLVQAVGAVANQGKLMKPYLVEEVRKNNGAVVQKTPQIVREVISARTSALLSGMLVSVVERGHGKRAGVPGYFVAGKTGTAQIPRADGPGYEQGATIGTFIGFAPVENPKFVMLTRIDRPQDVQFAESSAAPLFGELAKFLLQYFKIKPTRTLPGT